ncbi:unnamed protein product [Eruca vesicaria subsp. sativa]|uniref:Uncharacterized protein n=1 Tax=Eruca vesicaria subsp. sativa TaxID=29727 RepID=A0ABC8LXI8_ERUVS|nr:unnamed protein product [Eruca vesicaria subsp. sativa]
MNHIILISGNWKVEKTKWSFKVDNERGSILVAVNEETKFEDFVKAIFEDYRVDFAQNYLEPRYLFPKQNAHSQSMDAPVKIGNDRQFHIFLGLCNPYRKMTRWVKNKKIWIKKVIY